MLADALRVLKSGKVRFAIRAGRNEHWMEEPPSTLKKQLELGDYSRQFYLKVVPVVKAEAGDSRNKIAAATSSTVPKRQA
jgi:hypothetical protein